MAGGLHESPGVRNPFNKILPPPIVAKRDPRTTDHSATGRLWVNELTNNCFLLCGGNASGSVWHHINNASPTPLPPGPTPTPTPGLPQQIRPRYNVENGNTDDEDYTGLGWALESGNVGHAAFSIVFHVAPTGNIPNGDAGIVTISGFPKSLVAERVHPRQYIDLYLGVPRLIGFDINNMSEGGNNTRFSGKSLIPMMIANEGIAIYNTPEDASSARFLPASGEGEIRIVIVDQNQATTVTDPGEYGRYLTFLRGSTTGNTNTVIRRGWIAGSFSWMITPF